MKKVNLENVRGVRIIHTYYNYSNTVVCSIENYIEVINNLTKNGVQILEINFYE